MSGVAPDRTPDFMVDEDLGNREALLRAARPVIDVVAHELADSETALILTDNESRIIMLTYGGVQVERDLAAIGGVRGSTMAEDVVGTTALGTPIETRSSLTVNGAEHYLDLYKHLSCYGQPIVHPTTQRLEGILCMTSVSDRAHPLFAPMVSRLVGDIQGRLLDAAHASHRLVLNAFHDLSRRRGAAVVALGDDLLLTNTLASNLLESADIGALRAIVGDPGGGVPASITLTSGQTLAVAGQRVAGASSAAVFALTSTSRRAPIPRGPSPSPELFPPNEFQFHSGRVARSLAVLGEPGSGRSSYADAAVGASPSCRVDVPARIVGGGGGPLTSTYSTVATSGAILVIDGVELLGDNDLASLRRLIADRRVPVVLTGPPSDALRPAVAAVVALCDEQTSTTPLRNQPHRIPMVAQQFLARRTPRAKLSAGAVDALVAQQWPANVAELERVISAGAASAQARGSRLLDVEDLPARYRATSRVASLTVLDRVERQGIIDALAQCHGNKAHAAKLLGISRSTLYVRLKALGIDT